VRFQVTLNTSGRIAEIRRLGEPLVQFGVGTTVDDATRRAMATAIVNSGAEALRRWAYEAPSAPITFQVVFTFYAAPEPTAVQQDPPPLPLAGRGSPPPLSLPPPAASLPPWPPLEGTVQVGQGIPAPRLIKSVRPRYTPQALAAKVQGTVVMQIIVDTDGKIRDARVIRSMVPLLDGAALEAARQLEFTPTLVNGKPVRVSLMYETDFNLR
jgi:protein TonB